MGLFNEVRRAVVRTIEEVGRGTGFLTDHEIKRNRIKRGESE